MPRPNRYDINAYLPADVLDAHPAWLIAYDEEAEEGQDENTIKPNELGDPALPGYVVADVSFRDGSTALALVGGDFGVEALEDLDDLILYHDELVWAFALGAETCELEWPDRPFFETYAHLLPMQITSRLGTAFGGYMPDVTFSVDGDGAIKV